MGGWAREEERKLDVKILDPHDLSLVQGSFQLVFEVRQRRRCRTSERVAVRRILCHCAIEQSGGRELFPDEGARTETEAGHQQDETDGIRLCSHHSRYASLIERRAGDGTPTTTLRQTTADESGRRTRSRRAFAGAEWSVKAGRNTLRRSSMQCQRIARQATG
eukprot:754218-Hanusia_phi.AAC.1